MLVHPELDEVIGQCDEKYDEMRLVRATPVTVRRGVASRYLTTQWYMAYSAQAPLARRARLVLASAVV